MRFGKYELIARVGTGESFRAEGQAGPVVVEKLPQGTVADPARLEAARRAHPNIAFVLDSGEVEGQPFVARVHVDGRSLAQLLQRAREFGWNRLPIELSVFTAIEALKGIDAAGDPVGPSRVLLGFEGEVKIAPRVEARETQATVGALLAALLGPGELPPPLAELLTRANRGAAAGELVEPLTEWLAEKAPGFTGEVLRELLGQLFDADLLADGRLFVSRPTARARLRGVKRATTREVTATFVPLSRRPPPRVLLGLAAVLGVIALGMITFEVASARGPRDVDETGFTPLRPKQAAPEAPGPTELKPGVVVPPAEPVAPALAFTAESAPLWLRLTDAHQVVVPKTHCWSVDTKGARHRGSPRASGPTFGRLHLVRELDEGYAAEARPARLLVLFAAPTGPERLLDGEPDLTVSEPGLACAFTLTDRSLEQETRPPRVTLNEETSVELRRSLIRVEPDDRFQVRAFSRGKSWRVRLDDVRPPWPVLFVTSASGTTPIILNRKETELENPSFAWLTVPVLTPAPGYAREITIELAPGEQLTEAAEDLLSGAREHFERGLYGQAAHTLDRCINTYPAFAPCHRLLGDAFVKLKYRDEARSQYLEFLRLSPKGIEAQQVEALVSELNRNR
jgi:hypothetical protein